MWRILRTALVLNIGFIELCQAGLAYAAEPSGCYKVVRVDFWDVLYIREKQSHMSRALGAIAPDHNGIIRATGSCQPQNASSKRQWCPIDYFPLPKVKISGFIKAFFVERTPCPNV